jgi:membrane-associated phospholipid phosphatase
MPSTPRPHERAMLGMGVALLWGVGYFWMGWHGPAGRVHEVATPIDARIPFVAQAIWPYLCVFPLALSPLVFVRDAALMRRIALAYAATIVVSLLCFALYPVSASDLRPSVSAPGVSAAAVRVLYALDPPYNLCPSLHVSLAVLAAISASKALKRHAGLLFAAACAIAVSTCLIKQHFLVDVLAGAVLAALVAGVTLRAHHSNKSNA